MIVELNHRSWDSIVSHAQETFPDECCGIIFSGSGADRVVRLNNIQNQLQAHDPVTYPRTAVIAYAVDPLELDNLVTQEPEIAAELTAEIEARQQVVNSIKFGDYSEEMHPEMREKLRSLGYVD